jgi:hypothetical protein
MSMEKDYVNRKTMRTLTGLCGIIGVVTLISSFIINPGPPANASVAQMMTFALGAVFTTFGPLALFVPVQTIVNVLAGVQSFWFLGAAITLLVRRPAPLPVTQVNFVAARPSARCEPPACPMPAHTLL